MTPQKIKKQKLYINDKFIKLVEIEARYQTLIDDQRKQTLIKEWNDIVENYDDYQDLYLELNRYVHNRFLNGHSLIDGNKRMHRALTTLIKEIIKYEDIL